MTTSNNIWKLRKRGFNAERELAKSLNRYNNVIAWRIPCSGVYSKYVDFENMIALPDVVALRKTSDGVEIYGFQVKTTSKNKFTIRLLKDLESLTAWMALCRNKGFKAIGAIAVKFINGGWILEKIKEEKKNYVFYRSKAMNLNEALHIFFGKQRTLDFI